MVRIVSCAKVLGFVGLFVVGISQPRHSPAQAIPPAALTIHIDKPIAKVSPTLYGLMTEEINYSYDGGLYAELVQDRNFLASRSDTENWVPVPQGTAKGTVMIDRATGPSAALPSSLKVTIDQADPANAYGLRNRGWWGVPVLANTTYTGSLYAKGDAAGVHISLISNDTGKVLATAALPVLTSDWKQYNFTPVSYTHLP